MLRYISQHIAASYILDVRVVIAVKLPYATRFTIRPVTNASVYQPAYRCVIYIGRSSRYSSQTSLRYSLYHWASGYYFGISANISLRHSVWTFESFYQSCFAASLAFSIRPMTAASFRYISQHIAAALTLDVGVVIPVKLRCTTRF